MVEGGSSKRVLRIMGSLLAEIKEEYKKQVPVDFKGQLPKVHLHIDLESIREAEGVTARQGCSNLLKVPLDSSTGSNPMYDAVHLSRLLKMSASILGRKHLGSVSVTDYNPIIEDQRTGRMLSEFFYNLCIGICQYEYNLTLP